MNDLPPTTSHNKHRPLLRALILFLLLLTMLTVLTRFLLPGQFDSDADDTAGTSIGISLILVSAAVAFVDYRATVKNHK